MTIGLNIPDLRTPPLLRARTCSIVLSACRDDELENVRTCTCALSVRLTPSNTFFSVLNAHCVFFAAGARDEVAGFELWMEARLRRALAWTGWRSADDDLRARTAPAMQLDVEDIVTAVSDVERSAVDVGARLVMSGDFSKCDDRASVHGPPARRGHQVRST